MTKFRGLEIVNRFKVPDSNYEICLLENGEYTCNCPSWIFHKGSKVDCKHILAYKNNLNSRQVEITLTELKKPKNPIDLKEMEIVIDNYLHNGYDRNKDDELDREEDYQSQMERLSEYDRDEKAIADYMEKHRYEKE